MSIIGFKGEQYVQGTTGYSAHKAQYATSTYGTEHDMDPALIVYPNDIDDISLAIKHANEQEVAVAVRTGGHQYSGASSTNGPNIQLDLSKTFTEFERRDFGSESLVFAGVSWKLVDFNKKMGESGLFIPHGQCSHVCLGGHVQTGGFGQLGRSFGLLGDHVRSLFIVDKDGKPTEINKTLDPDMFYAFLGGSPGNLGILTHVLLQAHRAEDYPGAQGLKAIFFYGPKTLKKLLKILVKMSDDNNFPRNYDLCVSVLSSNFFIPALAEPGLEDRLRKKSPDELDLPDWVESMFDEEGELKWPRTIVVYAQYVPFPGQNNPSPADVKKWFAEIDDAGWHVPFTNKGVQQKPLSELTKEWIFLGKREFNLPYVKRTYATASRSLSNNGWVDWAVDRVEAIVEPVDNKQWLSAQFQCFGGKNSRITANAGNGTAYSWRDSSLVATMDNFYGEGRKDDAEQWAEQNDKDSLRLFSKQDRRLLWGSWGNYNLDEVWPAYYEDQAKYTRLQQARAKADPNGKLFTPNTFCVKHPLL